MPANPNTPPMSLAGRAAVMDLGLGSVLNDQVQETEEQRRLRMQRTFGMGGAASTLGLGTPYGG